MATTGHENEIITVEGMKASLQKLKTDHIDGKAAKANITAGDYNKVTVNAQGIVTGGSNPTTLAGHGITDAYTKTEVNGLVDTPHQNYVTVQATDQTTAATDVLPASGQAADTIYRVSNWDGSANSGAGGFDVTVYSEYAWDDVSNPNKYVFLDVKTQIGEVFDITAYNANTKYADLKAALGTNGANIPQSLQKGGMSVKFVQSIDNKYVQYRLMSDDWSNNTNDWSFCGDNVLVENPEYIEVKTDSESKILESIKTDGTKEVNIPTTFKDTVTIKGSINNEELTNALNSKVNKVEGKGLSTNDYDNTAKELVDSNEYLENPEFVRVYTDSENKILWAIKTDGSIYYGAGIPPQVIDYIQQKIDELSLDEYEDIVTFLDGLEEGDITLRTMLTNLNTAIGNEVIRATTAEGTKVDKVAGKSLIDTGYAESMSSVESPEWMDVKTDNEDSILEGIQKDGTKVIGANLKVGGNTVIGGNARILGNIEVSGVSYNIIDNPEYIAAWVDAEDKVVFGLKTDGKTYVGDADFLNKIKNNKNAIAEIKTTLSTIGAKVDSLDIDALYSITATENPEYIEAKTDSEGKLIAGRTPDGAAFENIGFSTPKLSIDDATMENIEDPEGRSEITTDSKGKVVSYRDKNGVLHEKVGFYPVSMKMPQDALEQTYDYNSKQIVPKKWYLPSFGNVVIKEETFYLTYNPGYTDKNGVVLIQMFDDTTANALSHKTLSYYYVKSTLTPLAGGGYDRTSVNENSIRLDFYVPKDIKKVNGRYYVKSTLDDGSVVPESIEVTQIVDIPPYKAWSVNKTSEHYCIADIDLGSFYQKTDAPISIKYQGNVSMGHRKRGLRITFYKANNYNKKEKVKIGEMLRLSGFNMKSFYYDSSRVKDPVLTNLIIDIWETRGKDSYPWNKDNVLYNGAIGMHKSFPIETYFGNEFFGLQMFGMKKDEKNYMLDGDDDSSGIFTQSNEHGDWNSSTSYAWDDEMGVDDRVLAYQDKKDSLSVESAAALDVLLKYIRGFINGTIYKDSNENVYDLSELTEVDEVLYVTSTLDNGNVVEGSISVTSSKFKKSMLEDRIDIESMIDYYIVIETFLMWDSSYHNLILYSGKDKKKFYPFFYDVDNSFDAGGVWDKTLAEIMNAKGYDFTFWVKFASEYKDNIINRYSELRKKVLTVEHLKSIYNGYISGIPADTVTNEIQRWGNGNPFVFKDNIVWFETRIHWLDDNIVDTLNLNN